MFDNRSHDGSCPEIVDTLADYKMEAIIYYQGLIDSFGEEGMQLEIS